MGQTGRLNAANMLDTAFATGAQHVLSVTLSPALMNGRMAEKLTGQAQIVMQLFTVCVEQTVYAHKVTMLELHRQHVQILHCDSLMTKGTLYNRCSWKQKCRWQNVDVCTLLL